MMLNQTHTKGTVFICSAGHSGSTLLDLLLGAHSKVESLGEITHLPKNLALNTQCCCGEPVLSCKFWCDILNIVQEALGADIRQDPYQLNLGYINARVVVDRKHQTNWMNLKRRLAYALQFLQYRYGLIVPQQFVAKIHEGAANKVTLFSAIRDYTESDWVVDSSKHYLEALSLYKQSQENTRIIFLVRDGRAVFYSGLKRGFSRKKSLSAWTNTYRRAVPVLTKHIKASHMLKVKYEELAQDPTAAMRKICDFMNIDYESSMMNFRDNQVHITNGNNMRFAQTSEIKLDTSWKTEMSAEDLEFFGRHARALNIQLGYE